MYMSAETMHARRLFSRCKYRTLILDKDSASSYSLLEAYSLKTGKQYLSWFIHACFTVCLLQFADMDFY